MARAKASQHGVEAYYQPASKAIVTLYGLEVWFTYTATSPATPTGAGVSQHGVEVFYIPQPEARLTQYGLEVWYQEQADVETGGGEHAFTFVA